MPHSCPNCGEPCWCGVSMDDLSLEDDPERCTHCDIERSEKHQEYLDAIDANLREED